MQEVNQRKNISNLCNDYVTIQSQLIYLIAAIVAGTVIWNRGPHPFQPQNTGWFAVRETTPPRQSRSRCWPGLEPNRTDPQVKTRTAGRLPAPFATTRCTTIWRYSHRRNYRPSAAWSHIDSWSNQDKGTWAGSWSGICRGESVWQSNWIVQQASKVLGRMESIASIWVSTGHSAGPVI
jgi:hypothetical protein